MPPGPPVRWRWGRGDRGLPDLPIAQDRACSTAMLPPWCRWCEEVMAAAGLRPCRAWMRDRGRHRAGRLHGPAHCLGDGARALALPSAKPGHRHHQFSGGGAAIGDIDRPAGDIVVLIDSRREEPYFALAFCRSQIPRRTALHGRCAEIGAALAERDAGLVDRRRSRSLGSRPCLPASRDRARRGRCHGHSAARRGSRRPFCGARRLPLYLRAPDVSLQPKVGRDSDAPALAFRRLSVRFRSRSAGEPCMPRLSPRPGIVPGRRNPLPRCWRCRVPRDCSRPMRMSRSASASPSQAVDEVELLLLALLPQQRRRGICAGASA